MLRATGLTLFPSEPSAHFNNPVCNNAKTILLIFMYEGFPLQWGWVGGQKTFGTSYFAVSFGLLFSIIFVVSVMLWVCSRETHPFQVWQ